MTVLNWFALGFAVLLAVAGRLWIRLVAAILIYFALDAAARLGARLARCALRLDLRIDEWRHGLRGREGVVTLVTGRVAYHVKIGATSGEERYEYLDQRDMDLLARAMDNLGCYVIIWPRRLNWRRRDVHCSGERLGLHALAPADRDAWADAIANLDGEGEQ